MANITQEQILESIQTVKNLEETVKDLNIRLETAETRLRERDKIVYDLLHPDLQALVDDGDMLKSTYDTDDDDVVDNSEKLEGSTKAEVQNHAPISHTLNSHSVPTADIPMDDNKLTGVKDPTANQDAATKKYVDDKTVAKTVQSIEAGQALTAGQVVYVSTGGLTATKEEENTTGSSNASLYGADIIYAQTFQLDIEGTVTKLNLKLRKVGSPSGDVQVDMYAVDGNDDPTGNSLGTITMVAADLGTTYALEEFVLGTAIDLDASTTYVITVKAVDAVQANRVELQYANSGSPYANGEWLYSTDGGSSWDHFSTAAAIFNVYAKPRAGRVFKTDASFSDERIDRIGIVDANVSAGGTAVINTAGVDDNQSGLTPGETYYLSDTAGAISTTPGTYAKIIGIAVSATEIVMVPVDPLSRMGHITISSLAYSSIGQGTWGFVPEAGAQWAGRVSNTSNGNGDNLSYKVDLAAGTYTLLVLVTTSNSFGIVDVDIDGVEVASFDCYSGSDVKNVRNIETGIVVASGGIKTLKIRVDGKNASSSDYYIGVNYISLWRTA